MPRRKTKRKREGSPVPVALPQPAAVRGASILWPALLIFVATLLSYAPTLRGGFIWDDDTYLTNNDLIRSPQGLHDFWLTGKAIDYYPVSNSSLWLEWRMWGMNASGYHVTNFVLHVVSVYLLWVILDWLSVPGGFLAALLFAVHR
jgi:hypothetical protein